MASWVAAAFTLVCLLQGYTCFYLAAGPKFQEVHPNAAFIFICQSDEPLTACQVSPLDTSYVVPSTMESFETYYYGIGLPKGVCGYTYSAKVKPGTRFWFVCRARNRIGQWKYATATAYMGGEVLPNATASATSTPDNSLEGVLTLEAPPDKVVVQSGSEVNLTFAAAEALSECSFQLPGQQSWVSNGSTSAYSIDLSGMDRGRCQLTLHNVKDRDSGYVKSDIKSIYTDGKRRHFMAVTTVIVKLAPSAPVLSLDKANGYSVGDVMEASCHVGLARPVAGIMWLLNNDVIQGELEDFTKIPWEYEAAEVTRKLSRKLSMADEGKELVCRVFHVSLPCGVVEARTKITVHGVKGIP